jgi:hypothetical protein
MGEDPVGVTIHNDTANAKHANALADKAHLAGCERHQAHEPLLHLLLVVRRGVSPVRIQE